MFNVIPAFRKGPLPGNRRYILKLNMICLVRPASDKKKRILLRAFTEISHHTSHFRFAREPLNTMEIRVWHSRRQQRPV